MPARLQPNATRFFPDPKAVSRPSSATPTTRNAGTMAPAARFRDGFSAGKASDRIEGICVIGMASRMTRSVQWRERT